MLDVELVFVTLQKETLRYQLSLELGATVGDALAKSDLITRYPEVANLKMGIFSRPVALDTPLSEGDRIEIYRPLLIDPKEKRRRQSVRRHKH